MRSNILGGFIIKINKISDLIKAKNVLIDGKIFDNPRNNEIWAKLNEAISRNDPELGQRVINQYIHFYNNAIQIIDAEERLSKEKPFHPGLCGDELVPVQDVQDGFKFCHVNQNQDWLYLTHKDLTKGLFINGPQGTGKTYPVLMLADRMLRAPPNERGFNIIFIQRMKREADYFSLKYPWFRTLEWRDLRYNIWQVQDWETHEERKNSATKIFAAETFAFAITFPMLKFAVDAAYRRNGVNEGSGNFPIYKEIMEMLPGYKKMFPVKGFKIEDGLGRLAGSIANFIMEGDNINCKVGMTTKDFLDYDYCINVRDTDQFTTRTTIECILYDMQRRLQKIPGATLVIIDEARWLFNVKRDAMEIEANQIVEDWFTTARSSGYGRIIITQEANSVSHFVTSNCAIRLSYPPIGEENIRVVAGLHNLNDEQINYIPKMAPFGEAIMTYQGGIG